VIYVARDVIMGADAGTGGFRIGLYSLDGRELGYGMTEYETRHERPGWAEQKPEDWWNCLKEGIGKAMAKAGVTKDRILSMAIDTHGTSPVISMKDGTPVRDCLIWMDVRSAEYAKFVKEKTGHVYTAEKMTPKLLWLKNNEPGNLEKTEVITDCYGWLMHKLTGEWGDGLGSMGTWGYDPDIETFSREFYEKIGLPECVDKFTTTKKPQPPGTLAGNLSKEAADFLGLDTDTLVVHGGIDSPIGQLGMGCARPGKIVLLTGSSHLVMGLSETPRSSPGFKPIKGALVKDLYGGGAGGQVSTGSITSWFKREFCHDLNEAENNGGISTYKALDEMAKDVPVGSEGLLVLEYWQGNRDPYGDSDVRGMIYGLSLNHTRAHIFRAIMEGIAYGTNRNLDTLRERGQEVTEMNIAGGASYSDLYMQIHADVSNCILNVPEDKQACALGCAICAAVGAGVYPDIPTAVDSMVRFEKVVTPIPENVEKYAKIYKQYKEAYPLFKDWMHETTALARE